MKYLPYMEITIGGENYMASPLNTALYMHDSEHQMYDHIFCRDEGYSDQLSGSFILRAVHFEVYENMQNEILTKGDGQFIIVANDEPTQQDRQTIDAMLDKWTSKVADELDEDLWSLDEDLGLYMQDSPEAYMHDINCKGCEEDCND